MFKIASNPTFKTKVNLRPVSGESGEVEFEFKYIKPKDYQAFLDGSKGRTLREVLEDQTVGWDGVHDADGNAVPFSAEAFGQMMDEHYVADTIFCAYVDAIRGAREKN